MEKFNGEKAEPGSRLWKRLLTCKYNWIIEFIAAPLHSFRGIILESDSMSSCHVFETVMIMMVNGGGSLLNKLCKMKLLKESLFNVIHIVLKNVGANK